jgi:hypothetical protein
LHDLLLPDAYENGIDWNEARRKKYYVFRSDRYRDNRINIKVDHIVLYSLSTTRFVKRISTRDLPLDIFFELEFIADNTILYQIRIKNIRKMKVSFLVNYNDATNDFYFYIYSRKHNWGLPAFVPFPHSVDEININSVYFIFRLLYPLLKKIIDIMTDKEVE